MEPSLNLQSTSSPSRITSNAARYLIYALGFAILAYGLVRGCNHILVGNPVAKRLQSDPRNNTFSLAAHYDYYLNTSTLVLDLSHTENSSPADLFRGIFQSAEALSDSGQSFEWVVLARTGETVFLLTGADFFELGREFALGQNPVYLIRTFPEKLYNVNGERAFSRWEGGILGVLGKQMSDANDAARIWAIGE